jgi:hypothetical protein
MMIRSAQAGFNRWAVDHRGKRAPSNGANVLLHRRPFGISSISNSIPGLPTTKLYASSSLDKSLGAYSRVSQASDGNISAHSTAMRTTATD